MFNFTDASCTVFMAGGSRCHRSQQSIIVSHLTSVSELDTNDEAGLKSTEMCVCAGYTVHFLFYIMQPKTKKMLLLSEVCKVCIKYGKNKPKTQNTSY